ncbi:bifunctional DNA primase/polymerase [Streptomyces chartreusis]|uniref:bifunctional DNA primase/polymerase n=1 Tax=Streptomyces chartreusis TaxID=1969 RepID=UPI003870D531|nr:bifunctional DNA primase/polymerase [Streptomyces chartreusis]
MSNLALLAWALEPARRGWHVFPLRPGDKRPAGHAERLCPATGRCAGGHLKPEQRATTDPDMVMAAWTAQPYNIGIATGPSRLLVVDLDVLKPEEQEGTPDGVQSLLALCERAGQELPVTYQVRTPSGGQHLYFTQPAGARLHSTAGTLGHHIDTRGWGGYVVAPGSTTPQGAYTVTDDRPPVPLPEWLQQALSAKPKRTSDHAMATSTKCRSGYAAAALRGEAHNVATAPDGTRNAVLLRAARALGRLVASGDLSRAEAEEALSRAAAGNATQSQRYYDDVIARGLDWSIAHNPQRRTTA